MRRTIKGAKYKSEDEILMILDREGFFIRQPIGYNWNGNDCEFTQPPEHHTPHCTKCNQQYEPLPENQPTPAPRKDGVT